MRGFELSRKLRQLALGKDPKVREKYLAFRGRGGGRLQGAGVLLALRGRALLGGEGRDVPLLWQGGPESALTGRESREALLRRLAPFSAVTFDVFDTLLLRPLARPQDLFLLLEEALGVPGLARMRRQAEEEARERKARAGLPREVTLGEIWAVLQEETGVNAGEGMARERDLEARCCQGDPYFLPVVEELRRQGKTLGLLSDMYLEKATVQGLVEQAGFGAFDFCLVSGEEGVSKGEGGLYRLARERLGPVPAAHLGDHPQADGAAAQAQGFTPFPVKNPHRQGAPYRVELPSPLLSAVYQGLADLALHGREGERSRAWEYGYVYGGLFGVGYCRFLHRLGEETGADRLLFLSRDGWVLRRLYCLLYPQEGHRTRYAPWSRMAAAKVCAGGYRAQFFRIFLTHKADRGFSLGEIFRSMELEPLLPGLCQALGTGPDRELTHKNREAVASYLKGRWEEVLALYRPHRQGGARCYRELLSGCGKAVAVDVGWSGTGPLMLDWAVNRLWGLSCPLTGALAGAAGPKTQDWADSAPFFSTGKLRSYLFSPGQDRDLWQAQDPGAGHNLLWELLLAAPEGRVLGFGPEGPRRGPAPPHSQGIQEIHQGMEDFARDFLDLEGRLGRTFHISGRDAWAPMGAVCHRKNRGFQQGWEAWLDEDHAG